MILHLRCRWRSEDLRRCVDRAHLLTVTLLFHEFEGLGKGALEVLSAGVHQGVVLTWWAHLE